MVRSVRLRAPRGDGSTGMHIRVDDPHVISITEGELQTPQGVWYDTGVIFGWDDRHLRVMTIEEMQSSSYDQKLICAPL